VASTTSKTTAVTGTLNATNSRTTIQKVQYSIDTATFSGTWNDCAATDGSFDSKNEGFSCSVTFPSEGTYTVRLRGIDSLGVYTAVRSYAAASITYDATAPALALLKIGNTTVRSNLIHFTYLSSRPRPVFYGSGEAGSVVTITGNAAPFCTATIASTGFWTCSVSQTLAYKDYAVLVSAKDRAGNQTNLKQFTLTVAYTSSPVDSGVVTAAGTETPAADATTPATATSGVQSASPTNTSAAAHAGLSLTLPTIIWGSLISLLVILVLIYWFLIAPKV
jgi:hypothetical protein